MKKFVAVLVILLGFCCVCIADDDNSDGGVPPCPEEYEDGLKP